MDQGRCTIVPFTVGLPAVRLVEIVIVAAPASESHGRQRTDLLTEGNRIHVEAAVWCPQEDLTRVEPTAPDERSCTARR